MTGPEYLIRSRSGRTRYISGTDWDSGATLSSPDPRNAVHFIGMDKAIDFARASGLDPRRWAIAIVRPE